MKCFVVVLSLLQEKTAINCLLKAGDQHSEMTKKNYFLLLIELGVLKALKRTFVFCWFLSSKDP